MQCQNNLKVIALALHSYHGVHYEFPCGTWSTAELPPRERLSWLAALLPYLDEDALAKKLRLDLPWNAEENRAAAGRAVVTYLCSTHPDAFPAKPHISYVGLTGLGADAGLLGKQHSRAGFFGYDRRITIKDITDGVSTTAAVIETPVENGPWAAALSTLRSVRLTENVYLHENGPFGMKHNTDTFFRTNPVVANAAFADASVRTVSSGVSPAVFRAMATIAGGDGGLEF